METHFKRALQLDADFDHAGADRQLGLLYLEAPGWPTSIGSRRLARQHLQRAVERQPGYPGNRLCWLEALVKWKEYKEARRDAQESARFLDAGRKKYTGEDWESSWVEWDERWRKIQAKLAETPPNGSGGALRRPGAKSLEVFPFHQPSIREGETPVLSNPLLHSISGFGTCLPAGRGSSPSQVHGPIAWLRNQEGCP